MVRWGRHCLGLLALIGCHASSPALAQHPGPGPDVVLTIENLQFSPRELHVKRGTRITWINKDPFPHTVTSKSKAFDSGSIAANASWTYVASKTGEYAYGCSFHPTMNGVLEVQ